MSAMVRTQVYLPQEIYEELRRRSEKSGVSMARQIRKALEEYLELSEARVLKEEDPIWEMIGAIKTKDGDLSVRHDTYIYGRGEADEDLR